MLKIIIYRKCDYVYGMIHTVYTELDDDFIKKTIENITSTKIIFIKVISNNSKKSDFIADTLLSKFKKNNQENIKIVMFIDNDDFKSKLVDNFRKKNITIKIKKIKYGKYDEMKPLLLNHNN